MTKYKLRKIKLGSFVKIMSMSGIALGIIVGLVLFTAIMVGLEIPVDINLFGWQPEITGLVAGIACLIIGPIAGFFAFGFYGVILYPFLAFFLFIFRGIKIDAKITEVVVKQSKKKVVEEPKVAEAVVEEAAAEVEETKE